MTFHGGNPFSVYSSADTSGTDERFKGRKPCPGQSLRGLQGVQGRRKLAEPAAFADAAAGTCGDTGRNAYIGPGYNDVDFSVFKNTIIGERVTTQFRVEMFNLFNRPTSRRSTMQRAIQPD